MTTTTTETPAEWDDIIALFKTCPLTHRYMYSQYRAEASTAKKNELRQALASSTKAEMVTLLRIFFNDRRANDVPIMRDDVTNALWLLRHG